MVLPDPSPTHERRNIFADLPHYLEPASQDYWRITHLELFYEQTLEQSEPVSAIVSPTNYGFDRTGWCSIEKISRWCAALRPYQHEEWISDLDEFCSHVIAINLRLASYDSHQHTTCGECRIKILFEVHGRRPHTAQPDVSVNPAIKCKNATFHLRKLTRPTANDRKTEDFPHSFTIQ